MRKEQEIFTQVNAQNVPVGADILDTLEQEVVNESIFREFLREYIDVSPEEELHPSQLNTVGQVLDLIQRIQDETDSADTAARTKNVGVEFIKIAMGEIPIVGGALGAADGLYAMYQAGKSEEHTWAELEEYPILKRIKMHPDLAKHLDPVTLKEVDKAYQVYLKTLGRETKVSEIKDIDIFTRDWIKNDTGGSLSVELLREYVRELIRESHFPIYAQDKMRIHHSRGGTRSGTKPQVSGFSQKIGSKPEGLWYECQDGSSETWEEFCTTGLTGGYDKYDSTYNVVLKDDGYHILHITDEQHLEKFNKMYSVNHSADPDGTKGLDKMIDWPKVAEHYAGIEICPYLSNKRNDDDFFWYYGWDVASGCVWDQKGIEELVKAGDCDEPTP